MLGVINLRGVAWWVRKSGPLKAMDDLPDHAGPLREAHGAGKQHGQWVSLTCGVWHGGCANRVL